ncbi:hypothetical protein AHAS_Ahas05G0180000 [Arachis hypogaea]
MNVILVDTTDTLPIIYEHGLFGMYHDWCKSFSTYPKSYDFLYADYLFFKTQENVCIIFYLSFIKTKVARTNLVTKPVE